MNVLLAVVVHWVFSGYHSGPTLTSGGSIPIKTHVNLSKVMHGLIRRDIHVQTLIEKKGLEIKCTEIYRIYYGSNCCLLQWISALKHVTSLFYFVIIFWLCWLVSFNQRTCLIHCFVRGRINVTNRFDRYDIPVFHILWGSLEGWWSLVDVHNFSCKLCSLPSSYCI